MDGRNQGVQRRVQEFSFNKLCGEEVCVESETRFPEKSSKLPTSDFHETKLRSEPRGRNGEGNITGFEWSKRIDNIIKPVVIRNQVNRSG